MRYKDIPVIRNAIILEQRGICVLCGEILQNPCLDHAHDDTGRIRGVLCRSCNSAAGVIERMLARYNLRDKDKLRIFLDNFVDYINNTRYEDLIHPVHTTKINKRNKKTPKSKKK